MGNGMDVISQGWWRISLKTPRAQCKGKEEHLGTRQGDMYILQDLTSFFDCLLDKEED